jgi:hypothetical protein
MWLLVRQTIAKLDQAKAFIKPYIPMNVAGIRRRGLIISQFRILALISGARIAKIIIEQRIRVDVLLSAISALSCLRVKYIAAAMNHNVPGA